MNRFFLVDCNNFYVSCEQVFNPKLNNKPVVILGSNDACVIARSNEAKALGIPMGAPAFECEKLFKKHNVIVHSANFALYGDMSNRVMQTVAHYATDFEIYSVDEAFLFVSKYVHSLDKSLQENDYYLDYAYYIKQQVKQQVGIPISIGIGPTKTLAKVANRLAKKNPHLKGAFDITDHPNIDRILETVDVGDIWGIGYRYAKLLRNNKILNARDFKYADEKWVRKNMTIVGHKTLLEIRGTSCLSLQDCPEPKQSITVSRSFGKKVTTLIQAKEALAFYVACASAKLRAQQSLTTNILVFAVTTRYHDPHNYYKATTYQLPVASNYTPDLINAAHNCLEKIFKPGSIYKKVGVIFTELVSHDFQQMSTIVPVSEHSEKHIKFMKAIDKVNDKWGRNRLFFAAEGIERPWKAAHTTKSACFTTNWHELLTITI
jgi:DNA polymerase V